MQNVNPSLKNGYLSIANEIVEQFALHNIPGNEMRIMWCVIRKTWGWSQGNRKKDWDNISLTQFEKMTDMNRKNVCRSLKSLVAKRLLLKNVSSYKVNQCYNQWIVVKRPPGVAKVVKGSGKCGIKVGVKRPPTKDIKETIQKTLPHKQAIEYFVQAYKTKTGDKYIFHGGKDGSLIQAILKTIDFEDFKKRVDLFFSCNNSFVEEAGYTIGVFNSQINKLKTMDGKSDNLRNLEEMVGE